MGNREKYKQTKYRFQQQKELQNQRNIHIPVIHLQIIFHWLNLFKAS